MKFSVAAVMAAAVAGANAHFNGTVVTEVVESYTTYCPGPTQITHGSKTYTVTEATTLTITDCPCTVTKPVMTTSSVYCPTSSAGSWSNTTMVQVPTGTGSVPAGETEVPTGTTPPTVPTGAAGKVGFSLAGLVGLAAIAL